jgi:hypothetical protein
VKLTREQYQDLEEYLVVFRERLNQTSTREEAIPLFKEALVELEKYGLLPNGMSVERAQRLVLSMCFSQRSGEFFNRIFGGNQDIKSINMFCLIAGKATHVSSFGAFYLLRHYLLGVLDNFLYKIGYWNIGIFLVILLESLPELRSIFFPFYLFNEFGIGVSSAVWGGELYHHPSTGTIFSLGLLGLKIYSGSYYGQIRSLEYFYEPNVSSKFYSGIVGFTGLNIKILRGNIDNFFLGSCLLIDLSSNLPYQ